jgi:hypothetical protein
MRQTVKCECFRNKEAQYDSYSIFVNNELVYIALTYYNTDESRIWTSKVSGWAGTTMSPREVRHQVFSTCLHHMYIRGLISYWKWNDILDTLLAVTRHNKFSPA